MRFERKVRVSAEEFHLRNLEDEEAENALLSTRVIVIS